MVLNYADVWRPQESPATLMYDIALIIGGSLLIALCAQISFHIGVVPITGQTFGVLIVGALLGWKRGAATTLLYLIEGANGLPVFASGTAGIGVLAGPTGGYLIGFVFAASLVGWLAQLGWDRRVSTTILAMLAGNLVIYLCGLPWLRLVLGVSWSEALSFGLTPFVVGDLIKIALAAALLPLGWKLLATKP